LEASGYVAGASAGTDGDDGEADDAATYSDDKFSKAVAPYSASVWQICCKVGDVVTKGQVLMVLEAMKMETPVLATAAGVVVKVAAKQAQLVPRSRVLVIMDTAQALAAAAD